MQYLQLVLTHIIKLIVKFLIIEFNSDFWIMSQNKFT